MKEGLHIPAEFADVVKVVEMGAAKHGDNSWLEPGVFQFNRRLGSEYRHLLKKAGLYKLLDTQNLDREERQALIIVGRLLERAQFKEKNQLDSESGLHHDLHNACNSLMAYTLKKRGIIKE